MITKRFLSRLGNKTTAVSAVIKVRPEWGVYVQLVFRGASLDREVRHLLSTENSDSNSLDYAIRFKDPVSAVQYVHEVGITKYTIKMCSEGCDNSRGIRNEFHQAIAKFERTLQSARTRSHWTISNPTYTTEGAQCLTMNEAVNGSVSLDRSAGKMIPKACATCAFRRWIDDREHSLPGDVAVELFRSRPRFPSL